MVGDSASRSDWAEVDIKILNARLKGACEVISPFQTSWR